jgi:hypothetical protein
METDMAWTSYVRLGVLLATVHIMAAYDTGSIGGRAVDSTGAYLPSPEVRLIGQFTSERQYEAVGDTQGHFLLGNVEAGPYKLTISVRGFEKVVTDIRISPGQHLEIGTVGLHFAGCNAPGVICDDFGLSVYNDAIHSEGSIEVPQLCAVDIDEGKSFCTVELDGRGTIPPARDADSDFWLRIGVRGEVYMTPRNGATLALNPPTEWSKAGCASASYSSKEVRIDGLPIGSRVCLRTTLDRYAQVAFFQVIPLRAEKVKTNFITWQGKADMPHLQVSPRK